MKFPLEQKYDKHVVETNKGTFLCKYAFDPETGSFTDVFTEDDEFITEITKSFDFNDAESVAELIQTIENDDEIL